VFITDGFEAYNIDSSMLRLNTRDTPCMCFDIRAQPILTTKPRLSALSAERDLDGRPCKATHHLSDLVGGLGMPAHPQKASPINTIVFMSYYEHPYLWTDNTIY
jgi:hypothetical protein